MRLKLQNLGDGKSSSVSSTLVGKPSYRRMDEAIEEPCNGRP